ncbi:histidine kinase [Rhizobium sp. TH135]|uniref:histidine kinase n=1 Tax=Rhizobium sp. TH135 TaxID=2067451 RepID=UPI000C79F361|nr:histidine kinase [Rhizobium sp. TH135]PLK69671.1 histidine kinase [Rhizobium sp. TH135]
MNKFLAATAIFLITASASVAGSFTFPADEPAATVEIPDDWQPTATDYGIEGNSPDAGTYISFDIAGVEDMDQVMTDVFAFLEENGVTPDPASQTESKGEQNGMPYETLSWKGTDKDGPVTIGVGFITLSDEKAAIVTYWASAETEEKNIPEVNKILESIKPAQ